MDDDQLSYRDSLDLSSQFTTPTDPDQVAEQDPDDPEETEPPKPPSSEPPEEETEAEEGLSATLAELNMNQSNNNCLCSPMLSLPLAPLWGKQLPLTRNRDSEPEFV